jgi:hypothetical protein
VAGVFPAGAGCRAIGVGHADHRRSRRLSHAGGRRDRYAPVSQEPDQLSNAGSGLLGLHEWQPFTGVAHAGAARFEAPAGGAEPGDDAVGANGSADHREATRALNSSPPPRWLQSTSGQSSFRYPCGRTRVQTVWRYAARAVAPTPLCDCSPGARCVNGALLNTIPDMIGRTIAHYHITAAIGSGGMGEVFRATDAKLARAVALKVLPADMAESPAHRHNPLRRRERWHPLPDNGTQVPAGPGRAVDRRPPESRARHRRIVRGCRVAVDRAAYRHRYAREDDVLHAVTIGMTMYHLVCARSTRRSTGPGNCPISRGTQARWSRSV